MKRSLFLSLAKLIFVLTTLLLVNCSDDDQLQIPIAEFNVSSDRPYAGDSVFFTDQSINNPTSWAWNFGDGTSSTEQNPSHVYKSVGVYSVLLSASNESGNNIVVKEDYVHVTYPEDFFEGIWLIDESIGDNANDYKYVIFEDSIVHFYIENQIGGHKYFSGQYTVADDSLVISGTGDGAIDSYNTWSIDGGSILISGQYNTFGGKKVSEMPDRDVWQTNIQLSNPEYDIQNPGFCGGNAGWGTLFLDLSKSNSSDEFFSIWTCGGRSRTSRIFTLSSITGEVIDEIIIKNIPSNYYELAAPVGQDKMIVGTHNSIELVDCNGFNYISTIAIGLYPKGLTYDGKHIWAIDALINDDGFSSDEVRIVQMDFDGNVLSSSSPFGNWSASSMAYGDDHLWLADGHDIYKIDPVELTTLVTYRINFNTNLHCSYGSIEYIKGEIYLTACDQMYKFKPD